MKKLLLAVLVALGLQTQAQITCDSITTTYLSISQDTIKMETNVMSFGIPFTMHSFDLYEGCQNGILTYYDTNVVASIPLPSPNLVDTFVLCNWSDFGSAPYSCYSCDTFVWNGNDNWMLMQQQIETQINCDSISYTINWWGNDVLTLTGYTSGLSNMIDSTDWYWGVCNSTTCYAGQGQSFSTQMIQSTDTIKVCLDTYIYTMDSNYVCYTCDWYVYDVYTDSWVVFYHPIPTSINEITSNSINNNRIYDLLGREILEIPVGTMYIKNNKLHIAR